MSSVTLEFFRFGANDTGLLRAGDRYLRAMAERSVEEITVPDVFDNKRLPSRLEALRYGADEAARQDAVKELGAAIRNFLRLGPLDGLDAGALHRLDLVANPAELAMLPFELVEDESGAPLLVRKDGAPVEITRRVRSDSVPADVPWAARPRVLFAWAAPRLAVPADAHRNALRTALDPWVPAFSGVREPKVLGDVLSVIERASLSDIEQSCVRAKEERRPFTHIHLLAHGSILSSRDGERFGLALHDSLDSTRVKSASPEELVKALGPLKGVPVIVTLAACDGANMENSRIPEKSVAHELHVAGFPVVVASQLPLTVPGSTVLVETLYKALLQGKNVLDALHEARLALHAGESLGHDWASLTAYVRLPERYEEHLAEIRLRSALLSLETTRRLSDELSNATNASRALLDEVEQRLLSDIQRLESHAGDRLTARFSRLAEEAFGLLGSAQKRLAEHYHRHGSGVESSSRDALERSLGWYRKGHERALSAHWLGVQSLSLEAVLKGTVSSRGRWYATFEAAEAASQEPREVWALGSLAELWLVAPKVPGIDASSAQSEALRCLELMSARVKEHAEDPFPVESTRRQLERYRSWWTNANGYFNGTTDLVNDASALLEALGAPAVVDRI